MSGTFLVTGASGFIGSSIVKHFVSNGKNDIIAIGRERSCGLGRLAGVRYYALDLERFNGVDELLQGVECVIHCAGLAGDWGERAEYFRSNVELTHDLIVHSKAQGVKRFVFFSSPSVYYDFRDHQNVREHELPKKWSSDFAETKYLSEQEVLAQHSEDFKTIALRPRIVLGAGDRHVMPALIRLHEANVLRRVGDGLNEVSTTHIANLMHAVDCVLAADDEAWGEVYNIADEKPVRLWAQMDRLFSALQLKPVTKKISYGVLYGMACLDELLARSVPWGYRPALTRLRVSMLKRSLTVSIEKARQHLGYEPFADCADAIQDFVGWWCEKGMCDNTLVGQSTV